MLSTAGSSVFTFDYRYEFKCERVYVGLVKEIFIRQYGVPGTRVITLWTIKTTFCSFSKSHLERERAYPFWWRWIGRSWRYTHTHIWNIIITILHWHWRIRKNRHNQMVKAESHMLNSVHTLKSYYCAFGCISSTLMVLEKLQQMSHVFFGRYTDQNAQTHI